jgi:K+-sensing histidine kinase KdpD
MVYVAGVLILPAPAAIVLPFVSVLASEIASRRTWWKALFNVSQFTIAAAVAGVVWHFGARADSPDAAVMLENLLWAALASLLYYMANSWLTNVGLVLNVGGGLWATWWENHRTVLLPRLNLHVMGILFAGAWMIDPRAIFLLAVPAAVTFVSFHHIRALELKSAETQRLADRWEALARVSERLGERVDPDALLRIAASLVVEHGADAARIDADDRRATAFGRAATPALAQAIEAGEEPPAARVVDLPLKGGGGEIGRLRAAWAGPGPDTEAEALLAQIADRIAVALHNALLVEESAEVGALREVAKVKGELLAAVSHELRTPLALVVGYGELLKESRPPRQGVKWVGERIYNAGKQLERLVNDLLEAGRLESGRFSLDIRPLDVPAVVGTALDVARAGTRGGHTFVTRLADTLPAVQADPARIQQVLANLLSNAARYAPAGGTITVVASQVGPELVVAVEDEGTGVPDAERERIFEKFYRTAEAEQRTSQGLGLGLAICRDLVEAHGGRIWVEDAPTGGARFAFALPTIG